MSTLRHPAIPAAPSALPRGLYVDEVFGPYGDTVVSLVDRHGRAIVRVGVAYPDHLPLVKRCLMELLEELDPMPQLQLL